MVNFDNIQDAIEYSIRHNVIARVTVDAVDIHAALAAVDVLELHEEFDGRWDVVGGEEGVGGWRLRVTVDNGDSEED